MSMYGIYMPTLTPETTPVAQWYVNMPYVTWSVWDMVQNGRPFPGLSGQPSAQIPRSEFCRRKGCSASCAA